MNTTAPATGLLLFRGSRWDLNPEKAEQPGMLSIKVSYVCQAASSAGGCRP